MAVVAAGESVFPFFRCDFLSVAEAEAAAAAAAVRDTRLTSRNSLKQRILSDEGRR